jgi:subtilisin
VLDGGIQRDHPDLRVQAGVNCLEGGRKADWDDRDGHGTFVAGVVGALDNRFGVVGYAPGARLYAVRVANPEGFIDDADLLCGIDWVAGHSASEDIAIANLSLSGTTEGDDDRCGRTFEDSVHWAICGLADTAVTPVVAAGNDAWDISLSEPATYSEALTVTAMGDRDGRPGGLGGQFACEPDQFDDRFAYFSNFATRASDEAHTIAAPGVCVPSTWIEGQYATWSGTSFSTPVVSATVGLCIESGRCDRKRPRSIVRTMVADAEAFNLAHPNYGYEGDPMRPADRRNYGWLIRAARY